MSLIMLDRKSSAASVANTLRIFRRQQAPAENGEDPLLKAILAIVCLILLEDPTDCGRIVHNDDVTEWKAGPDDRFFKMSLCPSLYWITL